MKNKICPFCLKDVSDHHRQCHYGKVPSSKDIIDSEDRKKEVESRKLKNTKSALDNK